MIAKVESVVGGAGPQWLHACAGCPSFRDDQICSLVRVGQTDGVRPLVRFRCPSSRTWNTPGFTSVAAARPPRTQA